MLFNIKANTVKILVITNSSGGLYTFRGMLLDRLISIGHIVSVVTPIGEKIEELEKLGVSLFRVKMDRRGINPIKDASLFKSYFHIVKEIKPDLIITYTIKPNVYGGIVARITKTKYAANITGLGSALENKGIVQKIALSLNRHALKKAKVVFFENQMNADYFVKSEVITKSQVHTLHGAGVDLSHYTYKSYPDDSSEFRFLFIGRVMKEKGIEELITALRRIRSKGMLCSLDVVGIFDEEQLKPLINECSDEGWLHYQGLQNDVRPFIENSHCFVLPSYHEGMANSNLECAACGRPIITSNIPGCKEAVLDGTSGFLCEPHNVDSLYEALTKMLKLSRTERESMGLQGRKYMEAVFDKQKVVDETISELMK